jgi:hypothetical protein
VIGENMDIAELVDLLIDPHGQIKKAEKFFTEYLIDNKQKIVDQLIKTGEYKIESPYGLTATITAKPKQEK